MLQLVAALEAMNEVAEPTADLTKVEGRWRVVYSTVQIMGSKRTKLGLREFVKLGEMYQVIDTSNAEANNEVNFGVAGFGLDGALTIRAGYAVQGPRRVAVQFQGSTLRPEALQAIFEANYDLLLGIFNPDGWLDITFLDDDFRVGRDDKGHVFVLQRA